MEKQGSPEPADPSLSAGPVAGVSIANALGIEGDHEATAISSKLFRCACVRRWLPLAYREELYHVLRLTGPLLLSRVLNFFMPVVITIFCGHIGDKELAGYALASATINIAITSTGYGLALPCDTLISQTFGGKNMKRVGLILQRSSLILLLLCLPCWALIINSHNILLLMHQQEDVARIAQIYLYAFLPAVPAMFLHQVLVSYLQNQGIILPQMYTAAVANVINLGVNYVLIIDRQLGVVGSAIASSFSQILICLLLFGYIRWKKLHTLTWGGWSTDCLQEWDTYMKLAVPSVLMVWFEWWVWEIGGFLAGALGENDLAAQHILVEIGTIPYMIPLGIHAAACVRVGNALGAGDTARALLTCKVTLVLAGTVAVVVGCVLAGCKSFLGYVFTNNDIIVEIVSKNLTVCVFLQFFDSLLCICSGILIGCGKQKTAAWSALVCYYVIGLTVGILLMHYAQLGILGLWLGIFTCVVVELAIFLVIIFRLDWNKVTEKAQKRAAKKILVTAKRPVSALLNEAMLPDFSGGPNAAQLDGEEAPEADGYSPVNTQDQELQTGHEAEGIRTNAQSTEGDAEQSRNSSTAKPQEPLSVTQLILRRGLAVLASVLVLAAGITFHFIFPAPEPSAWSGENITLSWANDSTPTPLALLELTQNL